MKSLAGRTFWKKTAVLLFGSLLLLSEGCGVKETAQVSVQEEEQEIVQVEVETEELEIENVPGTILGEEEVVLMGEDSVLTAIYTRVQGNGEYSIAYREEQFSLAASEEELLFISLDYDMESETPVFVRIRQAEADSAETLAEQLAEESEEECLMEETTIGEGEYPALWVSYAEGTEKDSRTFDFYVLRNGGTLYLIEIDCFVDAYEKWGEAADMILSTLRFQEG